MGHRDFQTDWDEIHTKTAVTQERFDSGEPEISMLFTRRSMLIYFQLHTKILSFLLTCKRKLYVDVLFCLFSNINFESTSTSTIKQVNCHKFLGIWFYENLIWSYHIDKTRMDISRSIGAIYKLRTNLPYWLKRQLYYTLVYSKIVYCHMIWGRHQKLVLIRHTFKKKVVRFIGNLPRR